MQPEDVAEFALILESIRSQLERIADSLQGLEASYDLVNDVDELEEKP